MQRLARAPADGRLDRSPSQPIKALWCPSDMFELYAAIGGVWRRLAN